MSEFKLPTEQIELPSKGLIYPKDNPLSSGTVEIRYMTAKEEDILTNQNYIKDGTVIDKLLKSLIVSKINYNDLVVGDKNAIMVSSRILGYGKDYSFSYEGEIITVDLNELHLRYIDEDKLIEKNTNLFSFTLPHSKNEITFKLLNTKDDKAIKAEIKGLQKIDKRSSPELSTRLKYMIQSVNGDSEVKTIREFVDNHMLARDSRAFRGYVKDFQPDINLSFNFVRDDGSERDTTLPMTVNFFWPDSDL